MPVSSAHSDASFAHSTRATDEFEFAQRPTFSRSNRLLRVFWGVTYLLLFRPSPRPAFAFRRWLLKLFGARVGAGVKVYPAVTIWAPWNLHLEDFAGVGDHAVLYNLAPIRLGRGAVISQYAYLCTGTRDFTRPSFDLITRPIHIGDKAWIATRAFVGPGVSVGEGGVAAACAVVVKDVAAYTIVGGNPARMIKQRRVLDEESIAP